MPWKGDNTNLAPNDLQEPMNRSEKFISDNRASQIRRDTDKQENFTITLLDIDETILLQLEQLQLQVVDVGKKVKVPIFYGSPEKWVSAQRDGYLRDKQGKLILPAIIFKRTASESDSTLPFFNRYVNTSVMKLYSNTNQYSRFATLTGQGSSKNEIFNIVIPSHMLLTYKFIIWTENVEQMNGLVETIQFNTKDYWGNSQKGFRFRTKIESYGHTVELQANEDRVVKTEFDLTTHGYILPDTITKLDKHQMTTTKMFTPKKIIIGTEVISGDSHIPNDNINREKWRNPNYPNLQADVPIGTPSVENVEGTNTISSKILSTLINVSTQQSSIPTNINSSDISPYLKIVPIPTDITSTIGQDGQVAYDKNYFYIYSDGNWRKVAISQFS